MTLDTLSPPSSQAAPRESAWLSIASRLRQDIQSGVWAPGQRLPSENELARQFGVNRHTLRRSLSTLCSQGLLRATQGSGTYVEDFAVELVLSQRTRHRANLALAGMSGNFRVLQSAEVAANAEQARRLKVPLRHRLLWLQVLAQVDGAPLSLSERWFPARRFAGLEAVVRETGSITQAFAEHGVADYTRVESRISADMPDAELAATLRQSPQRPVLRVDSVNVDEQGTPIELAVAWFAADRVSLTVQHGDQTGDAA